MSLVGATISGRYVVESYLGAGGMGSVYVATQTAIGRKVVIKVLSEAISADASLLRRFLREARAASTISHPNCVTIHDFGQMDDGRMYLVMELIEGASLSRVIEGGPMAPQRAARIVAQILAALEAAHVSKIVHRDIKPDNIMITPRPGHPEAVKVLDFGLAKLANDAGQSQALTQTGEVFGTPAYMAPEQARSHVCDHRADLYSVGVVLYEMLAGRRPFLAATPLSLMVQQMREAPPAFEGLSPPIDVDPALGAIVFKALAKEPDDRFQSATAFRRALLTAVGLYSAAPLPGPAATSSPPTKPSGPVADTMPDVTLDMEPAAAAPAVAVAAAPDDSPSQTIRRQNRLVPRLVFGVFAVLAICGFIALRALKPSDSTATASPATAPAHPETAASPATAVATRTPPPEPVSHATPSESTSAPPMPSAGEPLPASSASAPPPSDSAPARRKAGTSRESTLSTTDLDDLK